MPMPFGKAVVDMVMDQRPLGLGHRPLHCVKLGGKVKAGLALLDHRHDMAQMALGALETGGDAGVACVAVRFCHIARITPRGG